MKSIILIALSLFALNANAITWQVFGPCDTKPVYQGKTEVDLSKSLGALTVEILTQNQIPFVGTESGFNSIINTPTGIDAMEIVSQTELRAYGWCYSLNGKIPDTMPDQVQLTSQKDHLIWFYAYTTNIKNQWQDDYCSPAYWIKAKQFCGK